MDNASKALIMAGGILISVMVIGIAMYILSSARGVAYDANKEAEQSAVESFNRYYQSFGPSGCKISGIDVVNIYRKAVDDIHRLDSIHTIDLSGVSDDVLTEIGIKKHSDVKPDEGCCELDADSAASFTKQYTYKYVKEKLNDVEGYIISISITK